MRNFFIAVAGAISIGAGLKLAMVEAASANSLIATIANGMGWYFVARGIFALTRISSAKDEKEDEVIDAA